MSVGVFFWLCVLLVLYVIPTIVAVHRKHHNAFPIMLFNFFFGWTLVLWAAALIWATSHVIENK